MARKDMRGSLRVCASNPRYFADETGRPIYLTGSHTWSNIQEFESESPFDFDAYLDWLQRLGHNFTRLWTWECGTAAEWMRGWGPNRILVQPQIYEQTGPGKAFDGKPKFDLAKFNKAFFERLQNRVAIAMNRGIYVSVMLFQGWELERKNRKINPWDGHPFNRNNNINGVDGDPNKNGNGYSIQTLEIPEITRMQETYIRKVVDTVNDMDNVMYEISNESDATSTEWHYHMIDYVHEYEKRKPKQHPVGMTFQYSVDNRGTNELLFQSPADWVSPNPQAEELYNYCYNPPPADAKKVILLDTDHLWGIGGDSEWVWKAFTRGYNPIFMDPYDTGFMDPCDSGLIDVGKIDPDWESARKAMGQTRMFAQRINLGEMKPHPELAHARYCLANPGTEYLIYIPPEMSKREQVDLSAAKANLRVEWFNPDTGVGFNAQTIKGGKKMVFRSPFSNGAVLYIKIEQS